MHSKANTEAELRVAVIDRLIAASMRDVAQAREASVESWRSLGARDSTKTSGNLADGRKL